MASSLSNANRDVGWWVGRWVDGAMCLGVRRYKATGEGGESGKERRGAKACGGVYRQAKEQVFK